MPPLVAKGPDLPIELLEAHAAGELVIFAGAGISVPAGLPDFRNLVKRVYDHLGEEFEGEEARIFRKGEYDRVLGLLEGEDRVGLAVRRAVLHELRTKPGLVSPVHKALLTIAGAGNRGRVVTTNFDPLFLASGARSGPVAVGPQLPVPREVHWTGLVHLHGLIDEASDPDGRGLVLTSADFGRAYLLDRWASRFVSELFQNFDVLFVGYGVNDPVMRYLLDALAAERSKGGKFRQAFALAGVQGRRELRERRRQEWSSKGVVPIFYDSRRHHRHLVKTLTAWAELARGGLRTRKSWVLRHADHPPANPQEDDARFVVWALSDSSGAVARAFASREPAPDIGWLRIFEESQDLPEGRKLLELPTDEVQRDSSGQVRDLPNLLVDSGWRTGHPARLSKVSYELASWLARHLDKKPLLEWVLRKGGVLHPDFRSRVQVRLQQTDGLSEPFRRVWEVLASDSYSERRAAGQFPPHWRSISPLVSHSPVGRQEILRLIAPVPRFVLRQPDELRSLFRDDTVPDDPATVEDLVEVKVELAGGSSGDLLLDELAADGSDGAVLRQLAFDLPTLLDEALRWQEFGGSAGAQLDFSYISVPSISPHPQNRRPESWSRLIDLNRRAFEVLDAEDAHAARRLVGQWAPLGYPVFRRLILHAATESPSIGATAGLNVLLPEQRLALWGISEQREVLRFLRKAGDALSEEETARLCSAILEGPPQGYFREDLPADRLTEARERIIWKRLARLVVSGARLPSEAVDFLEAIEASRGWKIPDDFSDELASWHELHTGEADTGDEWRDRARREPARSLVEVGRAARKGEWSQERLRILLQEFGRPEYRKFLDRLRFIILAQLVKKAPSEILTELLHAVAWWILEQAARLPPKCELEVLAVVKHVLPVALDTPADLEGDPVSRSLNHPAGQLVEALLRRLWVRKPTPGAGMPSDIDDLLRQVMGAGTPAGHLARLPLALDLRSLFALDRTWCEKWLLPKFRWQESEKPADFWKNYLRHPLVDPDLLAAVKPEFLELFNHLPEVGSSRENAVRLFVFVTVEIPSSFGKQEITAILRGLPEEDLAHAAEALASLLEHSEQPEELWMETVGPWIEGHWPSGPPARTTRASRSLAEIALQTGSAFPEAVEALRHRLTPFEDDHTRVDSLLEKLSFAERFPEATLVFLDALVPDELTKPWSWSSLRASLDQIAEQKPGLRDHDAYRRLDDVVQAAGR